MSDTNITNVGNIVIGVSEDIFCIIFLVMIYKFIQIAVLSNMNFYSVVSVSLICASIVFRVILLAADSYFRYSNSTIYSWDVIDKRA